jgi:hypothetical protein
MDRDKMSNLYRGPSTDASYQVSLPLAEGFQRRRLKYEKLTVDRRYSFYWLCFASPVKLHLRPSNPQLTPPTLQIHDFFILIFGVLPLAEGFQRRRLKYEKLTVDRRMAKAHVAFGKVS